MTLETAPADVLSGAIGRFRPVPEEIGRYETDAVTGALALRAEPAQVARLAACGLPHRDDGERGPLFDYDDLMNVGMFCGSGQTVPEIGLRFLMRFASAPRDTWFAPRTWEVGVHPVHTPGGPAAGPAAEVPEVTVRVPDGAAPGVDVLRLAPAAPALLDGADLVPSGYRAEVRLSGAHQEVRDPAVAAVWQEVVDGFTSRRVTYQTVPEALRADHERAWDLGVADCIVAARLLAARLRHAGYEARARRGYLLGLFGSDHAWCEVVEDGVAKCLDPVFAFVATVGDERGAPKSPEFAAACRGSRFNRLLPCRTGDAEPLVYFDGAAAPYWAMVGVSARPRRTV